MVPLTAGSDLLGALFVILLFALPVVYIWLRSRGTLGDPGGRSLR